MKKQKVLIVKEHITYCRELADYLGEMSIFEIMPFAHDGYAAIQRIAIQKPDVLLLDAVLPKLDGLGVLKKLNGMGLSDGIRIIVMSPFNDDELVGQLQELGALFVIHLPAVPEQVFSRIVDFAIDDSNTRRAGEDGKDDRRIELRDQIISNYLFALSGPINLMGYRFVRAAIAYCVEHYGKQILLTRDVYPHVAEYYGVTEKQIERNIRTYIERTWDRGNIENINKLFGYTVNQNKGRPTNKEFIAQITERTIMRMRSEVFSR